MSRLRRHRAGLVALLFVAVGVLLVLVALDLRTWQSTIARDDIRFRALPAHRNLWTPATLLPGDPASLLLGTGDTLAYRRSLQLFWFSRIGATPESRQDLPTLRAETQQRLEALSTGGTSKRERSDAANLLGVLVVTTPSPGNDEDALKAILKRATGYFLQATQLDSGNVDAKENLELVLRISQAQARELQQGRTERLRLRPWTGRDADRQRVLMGGLTFLTPLDALFALAAAPPARRAPGHRAEGTRDPARAFASASAYADGRAGRRRHRAALSLVAVAAAQPVVVRPRLVDERADAQAFFVFDTSLSMQASPGNGQPTRLARAKRLALRLRAALPDLPVGIASMTDRTLPNLMPTTDATLFSRTLTQSVAVDRPPPSQAYHLKRATSFEALVPVIQSNFFAQTRRPPRGRRLHRRRSLKARAVSQHHPAPPGRTGVRARLA